MRALRGFPAVLFTLAFVVVVVATNVRLAFNSLALYELGFARNEVTTTTRLTEAQLSEAGRQIRDYLGSSQEPLDVRVTVDGTSRPIFTDREVLHMADVKQLVGKVYRVQEGSFLFLALFIAIGFFVQGNEFGNRVRRLLIEASVLTMLVVGGAGLAATVAFQPLFLLFHQLSFVNDLWQLDPYTSVLLQMFPQRFWLETTVLIGAASIAESLLMAVLLTMLIWWQQWQVRVAQRKAPQFT
ncbi:MAG: TIGR01906 family membrane protein [Chloroflexi bacterium]|nr:TIGR01906 family membrane protein [Chloroflexota bacterium]